MGGSSSKVTVGYKYNVGMHMALCHGPIDAVTAIHVDGRLAWSGVSNGGQITIDAPELFGGEKKEGGVSGLVDLDFGKNDQTANAYLVTQLGSDTPGFRGVMSAVLNQTYVGNNPYLKPWAFEMSRIHVREDGVAQWYDSKSAIGGRDGCPEFDVYSCSAYADYATENSQAFWPLDDPNITPFVPAEFREVAGSSLTLKPTASFIGTAMTGPSSNNVYSTHTLTLGGALDLCEETLAFAKIHPSGVGGSFDAPLYIAPPQVIGAPIIDIAFLFRGTQSGVNIRAEAELTYQNAMTNADNVRNYSLDVQLTNEAIGAGDPANGPIRVKIQEFNSLTVSPWTQTDTPAFEPDPSITSDGKMHFFSCKIVPSGALVLANNRAYQPYAYRIQVDAEVWEGPLTALVSTGVNVSLPAAWRVKAGNNTRVMDRANSGGFYGMSWGLVDPDAAYEALQQNFSSFGGGCPCTDMNPAHIVREALTESWGLGHPDADIDDTAFTAAADALFSEGMGMSILWDKEIPIEDFIAQILQHINAELYVSRTTGKFVLKLIRDDYDIGDLLTLDQSNAQMATDASRPSIGELVTSVTVNFTDSFADEEPGSITVHNEALLQMQGADRNATVDYVGFMSRSLAKRVALRDLKALSTPLLACEVTAHRVAATLNIGDVFVLNFPEQGIPETVMRVQSIAVGDGLDNSVAIQCIEDVFSSPPATVAADDGPSWSDPLTVTPLPAVPRAVIETPYYELVQSEGQLTVDTILADEPDAAFLAVTAGRQGGELNANLLVDSGAGIVDSGTLDFAPYAALSADAWYSDAKLYYTGGKDIDLITAGDLAQIGDEIVRFDSLGSDVDGSFMNVGRGALDTVPAKHLATANILFFDFASDSVQYTASDSVDVTLRTALGSSLSSGEPVDNLVMDSRAIRPYPPGDLKIDAASYPTNGAYSDTNVLTWAHRDRLQQTSGTVYDYTAASIGPEAGVAYTVTADAVLAEGTISADFLSESVAGLTTYTHSAPNGTPPADAIEVRYKVTSIRDTYESWQPAMVVVAVTGVGGVYSVTDPYFADVELLLPMDGADGSATFVDRSRKALTVTTSGDAQIDTAQSKFGGASGLFDGTGDYLTTGSTSDFKFLHDGSRFTFECWARISSLNTTKVIFDTGGIGSTGVGIGIFVNSTNKLDVTIANGSGVFASNATGTSTWLADTWYHVAVISIDGGLKTYIDGDLDSIASITAPSIADSSELPTLGRSVAGNDSFYHGHLDEVRVTKDIRRYGSTVIWPIPTAAFPHQLIITTQPADMTVPVGSAVTFTAAAGGGDGAITYQWKNAADDTDISGETSATYSFTTDAGDDGRAFYVTASDDSVSIDSRTATLTEGADANFADVSLLLHMDGADRSTVFTDSSASAVAVTATGKLNGTVRIETAQSKFGGAAGAFFGGGGDLSMPKTVIDWTTDFTIEFWANPSTQFSSNAIFSTIYDDDPGIQGASLSLNTSSKLHFISLANDASNTATTSLTTTASLTAGEWSHVAVVRDSGTMRLFIDGVADVSGAAGVIGDNAAALFTIGADGNRSLNYYVGLLDDFRITKGVARYTAAFTPPTAAFPDA